MNMFPRLVRLIGSIILDKASSLRIIRMISEIYYEEIDPQIASPMEMARFYYLYNLIGVSDIFEEAYIDHEIKQLSITRVIK